MKKISLFLIIVVSLFAMLSCSNEASKTSGGTSLSNPTSTCVHEWEDATCTLPETCSICGKTRGDSLGHTTTTGVCFRCKENFSSWETGEYVDEFNLPTGIKYVASKPIIGTFSNSATTNSTLLAVVQIDINDISIILAEYGSHLVKGIYDYENYNVSILDDNNVKHTFTATINKGSTRIYFKDADRVNITKLLSSNENLDIYIKSTKYSISTYLFTLPCTGFADTYSKIK